MKSHRFLIACLLILAVATPLRAEFDWGAKYTGEYMSGQSSARLLALGGTGVAYATGPSALLANPARLYQDRAQGLSLMHADRFESAVRVDHAAWVRALPGNTAFGLGMVRQGVDGIPITQLRDPSLPLGPGNRVIAVDAASASEYAFLASYARPAAFADLGATAKLLYKKFYENSAWGLGVDVGASHQFGNLGLGLQIRDALSSLLVWDTGRTEGIVPTVRAGAAYNLPLDRLQARAIPVVEVVLRTESWGNDDAVALLAGFEYSIRDVVSARIGLDENRLTYGAGLKLGPVQVDYAFIGHEDLGATHRISLVAFWGAGTTRR